MRIDELVRAAATQLSQRIAVETRWEAVSYAELDRLSNQVARALLSLGVEPGDRVAVWAAKSARVVACLQGILRAGAAYVPIDPRTPGRRAEQILKGCKPAVLVADAERRRRRRRDELDGPRLLAVEDRATDPKVLRWSDVLGEATTAPEVGVLRPDALAYILYTSGSTGTPKGVCISHENAWAFVEWAVQEVGVGPEDRLANHAPFHFDLSVFDLYAAFRVGATVVLVDDSLAWAPSRLVALLRESGVTVWYSVPSVLMLMMEHGGLLDASDYALRTVLFAGEPFPVKHLRRLREHFPRVRMLNLYGPTETNVCTFFEVSEVPNGSQPVPIGRACCGNRVWAVREGGRRAHVGEEGVLQVEGPTVMMGYWGGAAQAGRPYETGDVVRVLPDGNFQYLGRRDDMVKVRGHRIELHEIEASLMEHPRIREAAVVVVGEELEARLWAFVSPAQEPEPSLLELKRLCADRLPPYMTVDHVCRVDGLPRTGNGKVDRRRLSQIVSATPRAARPAQPAQPRPS